MMDGAISERAVSSANNVTLPAAGVGSDAKPTRFPLEGIRLTVHILGSRGCGKSTLYDQWRESSVCAALRRFADVQIKQEDGVGPDTLRTLDDPLWTATSVFVVMYRSSNTHSAYYAKECLSIILTSFKRYQPNVILLENVDNPNFDAETQEPSETPDGEFDSYDVPFFVANVKQSVQLPGLFEHAIVRPLLQTLDDDDIQQIMSLACQSGSCTTLKLLVSAGKQPCPQDWIVEVLRRLSDLTVNHTLVPRLLEIVELTYHLDKQNCLDYVRSQLPMQPTACLLTLNHVCQQTLPTNNATNRNSQYLLLDNMKLQLLPAPGVANTAFTQISLAGNSLESIPEELMQLSLLTTLNLSRNDLEQFPSVLRWNCPKLRELNLSHNRLVDSSEKLLKQRTRGQNVDFMGDSADKHSQPQQKLLHLTGQNLYPCIYSLKMVDLSHNPRLSQLPDWVCVLPNLALLNIQSLPKLKQLPHQLAIWNNLAIIRVDLENITSPPPSVCQQGSQAIIAYLRCQLRGSLHYRHMRLMLLGKEGVGKTSTFKQLVTERASRQRTRSSMEVAFYEYRSNLSGKNCKVTYHLIDFEEHSTTAVYKCFLTQRCVYLCLWNAAEGKSGLESLIPWLHCIHSSVSNAAVILVGTHADQDPSLTNKMVTQWQQEVLLSSGNYSSHGLPRVAKCVLINSHSQADIERLKREIHSITMQLSSTLSSKPLIEEQVPRSYIELQGLVETKVKQFPNKPHIMTYEEFIDSYRSISHTAWDMTNEEEFALACQFLHDAGVIVQHCSSRQHQSSVFFLSPQWLSNILFVILRTQFREVGRDGEGAVLSSKRLQQILDSAEVPSKHTQQFTHLMEQYNMVVALNMERSQFLVPSLLPSKPSSDYPLYDLSKDVLVQCTSFVYLPGPVFQQLQTRVLLHLHQLGAQLITLVPELEDVFEEEEVSSGDSGTLTRGKVHASSLPTAKNLKVDRGYIVQKDESDEQEYNVKTSVRLLRALSIPDTDDQPELRDDLHNHIGALSRPFLTRLSSFTPDDVVIPWVSTDQYSRCLLWEKGMHIEFLCGTKAWMEVFKNGGAIVTSGSDLARVKTLTFLSHCLDIVLEESYPLLNPVSYSPCPSCLSSASDFSFLSQELQMEPQDPYSADGPTASSPVSSPVRDFELQLVSLNNQILLFPASYLVKMLAKGSSLFCPRCLSPQSLSLTAPHIQLADFSSDLPILQRDQLEFSQCVDSQLGRGGYANVYRGTYNKIDVAVKVFHDRQHISGDVSSSLKALRKELTILSSIQHPLVHPPIGIHLNPMSIVFELAPLGSLQDHLMLCPSGLEERTSHQLLYQIAHGLQYLHSLSIIHRDIKPSNVLVWSLHPQRGVKIRITDCGISQFSTPRGLRVAMGTEEYMAPELVRSSRNRSYTEKVDIFSFGILLHFVVTGSRLMPSVFRSNSSRESLTSSLNLSKALAAAFDEERTRTIKENAATSVLENCVHPAERRNQVTTCVSSCMQPLLMDCLSTAPNDRPSAFSISSRLLLCCGFLPQEKILLHGHTHFSQAFLAKEAGCIVAQLDNTREITLLNLDSWAPTTTNLPLDEKETPLLTVTDRLLIAATQIKRSFQVYRLPDLSLVGDDISLPYPPSCLFTFQSGSDQIAAVGTEAGHILLFSISDNVTAMQLCAEQIFDIQDSKKSTINAGVYHHGNILCGCGRYLISVNANTLEQQFIRPLSDRRADHRVIGLVISDDKVWATLARSCEVVVCDVATGNRLTVIDCKSQLVQAGVPMVSMLMAGSHIVWVGTQTGYLLGYDPHSFQLMMVACRASCVDSVVCVGEAMVVLFGRWVFEGITMSGFTVWHSHINSM